MGRSSGHVCALALGLAVAPGCIEAPGDALSESLPPCAAPSSPGFDDVLLDSDVPFVHDAEPTIPDGTSPGILDYLHNVTAGVVAADLDGDGWVDLFFPQPGGGAELFWGVDGTRFEPAMEPLPATVGALTAVASVADFDGDGLLDLAVGAPGRVLLLRNVGDRRFEDVTAEVGLADRPGIIAGVSFGDVEGDGDLDLFVCRHVRDADPDNGVLFSARSDLWANERGGFALRTDVLPYEDGDGGTCLHAAWTDIDRDGDVDLLQTNDFGDFYRSSLLLENRSDGDDWSFIDRAEGSVASLSAPMGAAIRDLDGSGLPDLWFSNLGPQLVFNQVEPWLFVDVSLGWAGDTPQERPWTSWSVIDVDLAGHGRPGALVTYGPLSVAQANGRPGESRPFSPIEEQPDRFFFPPEAQDGTPFAELSDDALGTDANSRGAALADLDRDGVPDVVIGHIGGPPSILRGRCTDANRLVVELRDPRAYNRFGVGARVTVTSDGRTDTQEVRAGGRGSFSGSDPALLFGIGAADRVDRLEVRWPDGEVDVWTGLCGHCRVFVERSAEF